MSNELPPLPHPVTNALMGDDFEDLYTADQMREYGRACERAAYKRAAQECIEQAKLDGAKRPPTPVGWSDTDWIKHLQEQAEQPHPLAGQHINQGSMDAAADAYEAEYSEALKQDAARYRWLRGDSCPEHSPRWTQWEVRCWKSPRWSDDLRRAELDAAIDAARREK